MDVKDILGQAFTFVLGRILVPGTDWKAAAAEKGIEWVHDEVTGLWRAKLTAKGPHIVSSMTADGWSWESAEDPNFLNRQKVPESEQVKGPVHCFSRDAIYCGFREIGVPGGPFRDGWRDAVDDAVSALVAPRVIIGTTSIAELVSVTGDETVNVVQ